MFNNKKITDMQEIVKVYYMKKRRDGLKEKKSERRGKTKVLEIVQTWDKPWWLRNWKNQRMDSKHIMEGLQWLMKQERARI